MFLQRIATDAILERNEIQFLLCGAAVVNC